MATSASPYDPLFYPLHAYIDYLFTQWQANHPNVQVVLFEYNRKVVKLVSNSDFTGFSVATLHLGETTLRLV